MTNIYKKKINYILGIQSYANHDSGASILKFDNYGKVLDYVAISEERLIRKKYPYTFPIHSILYCLEYFKIKSLKNINYIFSDWIRIKKWIRSGPSYNYQEFDYIKEKLKFKKKNIIQIDHHLAHAASTYYPSGFKESSILIVDGNGSDLETNSYFIGKKNKIKLIEKYKHHGIGSAYTAVTNKILNLGTGGEGKTMGLAPYGRKKNNKKISYKLNGITTDFSNFMRRMPISDVLNQLNSKLRPYPFKLQVKKSNKKNILQKYFTDWAYEIQSVTEKVMVHLGKDILRKTKNRNICLAGGVALNSVANQKLFKKNRFKKIFVFPACSDVGIPFGLVLWAYYNFFKGKKKIKFNNAYTGKSYSEKQVLDILNKFNIKYKITNETQIAKLIADGKIIGNFWGKSEYGPRALGNRSILADSRSAKMRDYLNIKVKHREVFRPFAPAILEEECYKYFDIKYSPFMLQVADAKKSKTTPSVIHVDNTARVQTVNNSQNPRFYKIIKNFYKLTNVPCILNTSFNDAGEPMVETPLDALICFLNTGIDFLILNNFIISKEQFSKNNPSKKLMNYRRNLIERKHNKALKIITKNFSKKEMLKKIKSENKKAVQYVLSRPLEKYKKIFLECLKNKNSKYLIIGTNDHTKILFKIFKDIIDPKIFDYYELKKNEIILNKKFKINLKKISKLNNLNKYNKIILSTFEYMHTIKKELNIENLISGYDNSSRSLIDYYFIKKYKSVYNFQKKIII